MHVIFDEANFTLPAAHRSSSSQVLVDLGYTADDFTQGTSTMTTCNEVTITDVLIQHLSSKSHILTRGSTQAVGYDVYSPDAYNLQPNSITKIPLDITIQPPSGTYIQLLSRSGLALKGITVLAGVIDPDYRGNITVLLHNNSSTTLPIQAGDT
jgi:dUTP pyrophosphatase